MSEKNHPINDVMTTTLAKLKEMIDVDTIVGKPIETADGTTLIPVSQLSLGFASGGSEFSPKTAKSDNSQNFGGGSGAGVKIEPMAFLVVKNGSVRLLPMGAPPMTTLDRVVDMVPEVVDKVTDLIDRKKSEEETF